MEYGQANDHEIGRIGGVRHGLNIKSEGQVEFSDLSADDQAKIEKLFEGGSVPPVKNTNDVFNYRITTKRMGAARPSKSRKVSCPRLWSQASRIR